MNDDDSVLKIMPYLGKPLEKWPKAALIEEVKRLRKLEHARILDIMELQGINKGKVSTEEIDAALQQLSGRTKKEGSKRRK
jgi:hypothetical protein